MPRTNRYLLPLVLLLAAAAVAAAAVLLIPEAWLRWVPAVVGAAWTVGMLALARRLRAEAGGPAPRDLRAGVVSCGLLTALAVSWAAREQVGGPELLLLAAALVAFGFWARAMARERRRRRLSPPAPPGPVLRLRDRPRRPRPTRWH